MCCRERKDRESVCAVESGGKGGGRKGRQKSAAAGLGLRMGLHATAWDCAAAALSRKVSCALPACGPWSRAHLCTAHTLDPPNRLCTVCVFAPLHLTTTPPLPLQPCMPPYLKPLATCSLGTTPLPRAGAWHAMATSCHLLACRLLACHLLTGHHTLTHSCSVAGKGLVAYRVCPQPYALLMPPFAHPFALQVGNVVGKGNRHFFLVFLWLELWALVVSALVGFVQIR